MLQKFIDVICVFLPKDYLDVNVKEEPNSASSHHSTARGKNGSGQSSNAPPTPWVPPLWKQQYENIRKMRETRNAPVDTHGCFMLAEKDVAPEVYRKLKVLQTLFLCHMLCFLIPYWWPIGAWSDMCGRHSVLKETTSIHNLKRLIYTYSGLQI